MCMIEALHIPIWNQHFMKSYTFTIWMIGLFVLLYWILELITIRNIFRCSSKRLKMWIKSLTSCTPMTSFCKLKLPVAFLMILLSTLTSLLSSTLFLYSSYNPSNITCSYSPIIAILLRFISKHSIWGFNIVRGQIVTEMLENKFLNIFVKHTPYILTIQMIVIFTMLLIFNSSFYDQYTNECSTEIPLILLILIAFIGEFVYGIGFIYIFIKSMTTSMQRVMVSLRAKDREKTKKQLIHHLSVYLIQFLLSCLYMISVGSCSNKNTFANFQIFAAELSISNICVLTLFRGRIRRCKKHCKCCRKYQQNSSNQMNLAKYVESNKKESVIMNKKDEIINNRPILIPTISNLSQFNEYENKEDILNDLPELQLTEIRKRIHSDHSVGSPVNSAITSPNSLFRNNSISVNPLLPNSWLSPQSIETFRVSLIKNNNIKSLKSLGCNNYISQSAPIFTHNNGSPIKPKTQKQIKSQSTPILEINYEKIYKLINTQFEFEEKENFDLKLKEISNIRSKSLFINTAGSTDLLSLEDTFKISNISENKDREHSVEIVYNDDVMTNIDTVIKSNT